MKQTKKNTELDEIIYLDIREFRERGYLQELNRLFLHPLGLALEVVIEADGTEQLGGIWDYREDPEGMNFAADMDLTPKAIIFDSISTAAHETRLRTMGYIIQPR